MGLPEVNRARIEQLNLNIASMQDEVSLLKGDVESIDPIVNDNSFPNIVPKIPVNVTASSLFRNVQVMWAYDTATYIAAYEVYASKENGFTPLATHLVWSGKAGAYNHEASTGETWHFRVRAINTHGVASDYSEQVSASTVDISGFEIDEQWQIDTIEYANQYTDERKTEIMQAVADKADYDYVYNNLLLKADAESVNQAITRIEADVASKASTALLEALEVDVLTKVDAEWVNGQLVSKADKSIVDTLSGTVSATTVEVQELADSLTSKVDTTTYTVDQAGVISSLDSHNSRITQNATDITSKVSSTAYNAKVAELAGGISSVDSRLTTAETTITQQNNAIALRALATDVYKKTEVDTKLGGKADGSAVTAIDTRVKSTEAELLIQAEAIISKVEQTTYTQDINGIISDVSSHNTRITQNATAITQRVTNTTFNALAGRVGTAESTLTQQAGQIALRVTQEEYDADINDAANGLIARMTKSEASITTLSDSIELMATKSSVDTRIGDVVHDLSLQDGRITVNANAINQRVTTTTYNALAGRVSTAEGSITTMAGQVALKATQSDLNALDGRLDTAEATLKVLPGQISTKVEKNGVISSINQSAELIKINVAKLTLNGDFEVVNGLTKLKNLVVDKVHIKDGAIIERMVSANVIANVINAGTANIDFAKIGNVTITNAMVSSLSASKLTSGTITGVTINGSTINSRLNAYNYTTITNNHFHSEGQFVDTKYNFGESFGEFDIHDGNMYFRVGQRSGNTKLKSVLFDYTQQGMAIEGTDGNSSYLSDWGISFGDWIEGDATGYIVGYNNDLQIFAKNKIRLDSEVTVEGGLLVTAPNSHIYLEESDNSNKRWHMEVNNGDFTIVESGVKIQMRLTRGGGTYLNGTLEAGTDFIFDDSRGRFAANGSTFYMQMVGTEGRVTKFKSTTLAPLRASSFPTGSSMFYKSNKELFSEYDAYFLLDNVDIFKYHLNVNLESGIYDKPKIGMMTEMVPSLLRDEDGIEPYSIVSALWRVAQSERKKRISLEQRVTDLEELLGVIVAS